PRRSAVGRAPRTRAPRRAKSPSRAISEIGRVPGGTGARRTPPAVPAITRTAREPIRERFSGPEEPVDRGGEPRTQLGQQRRMALEPGVVGDHGERAGAGAPDQVDVLGEPSQLEIGHAALPSVEQGSLPPKPEILVGE